MIQKYTVTSGTLFNIRRPVVIAGAVVIRPACGTGSATHLTDRKPDGVRASTSGCAAPGHPGGAVGRWLPQYPAKGARAAASGEPQPRVRDRSRRDGHIM